MPPPDRVLTTIPEVLDALDRVLAQALERGSRDGYFAAIYRKVTAKVGEGVASGFFDDGDRMERLDAGFASRYLTALAQHDRGEPTTRSWAVAFAALPSPRPLILQHLLLGIHAHLNLDLGIAAAETAPGASLPGLRRDFDRINEILRQLVAGIEDDLGEVSPWLRLLFRVGGPTDEEVIRFSLEVARSEAWRFATELAPLARDDWGGPIGARDTRVARLARLVMSPGWLQLAVAVVRARESNDVRRNIRALLEVREPDLAVVEARVRMERAPAPTE